MPGKPTVASVEIGDAPPKGETRVRRAFCSPDRLVHRPTGDDGNINTMADVLQYAVRSEWATGAHAAEHRVATMQRGGCSS